MSYPIGADQAYYTVARFGAKSALLGGPYDSHSEAAALVDEHRVEATRRYPTQLAFADFGVAMGLRLTEPRLMFPPAAVTPC